MKSFVNAFFSATLLLATIPAIQAMQPAKRAVKATKKQFSSWINAIEEALTGATPTNVVITQLNTAPTNPLSDPNGSDFYNLPQYERRQIIFLLSQFGSSNNLSSIGQAINTLAQVNKELNALINNREFYLNISRGLARQFGVSNEEVAKALQTERAKRELSLQQDLSDLCYNTEKLNENEIASVFLQLMKKGVDLNFIYQDNKKTPLMMATVGNPTLAFLLLESGANFNIYDEQGNKILRIADFMGNDELVKAIKEKLNQKK